MFNEIFENVIGWPSYSSAGEHASVHTLDRLPQSGRVDALQGACEVIVET
jgi:hypothetical protein